MIASDRLAQVFVEVADTLVDEFDMIDFLQKVTAQASELVGARAAGLLLSDPQGRLQLMAASDERAEMIELFQVRASEGPAWTAFDWVKRWSTRTFDSLRIVGRCSRLRR